LKLAKPKAILFDWDNTLIDSWAVIYDALNFTLRKFDKDPWSITETKKRVGKSLRDSFPELFGENWKKASETFYRRFEDIHITQLEAIYGAQKMLEDILKLDIYMGIVSNKQGDFLRKEICHLGWKKYFSSIVGAGDAKNDKPSIEPVIMALMSYGEKSGAHIWFVGDTEIDMECAKIANLTSILIRKNPPQPEEFLKHQPDQHVSDCQALSKLIKKL